MGALSSRHVLGRQPSRRLRPSCATCAGRATSELAALGPDAARRVDEVKMFNVYEPGQNIFYQGNPALGLYCVESGTVALRKTDAAGNASLVRLVHAGETLGYRAFFSAGPYEATAEAMTECRVCFIERNAVDRFIDESPMLARRYLQRLSNDLEAAEADKLASAALPLRGRFARLLLDWKDRFGEVDDNGTIVITLPLSRQDIASVLGTRPETVARLVRALSQDGVAHFHGRRVEVDDLDKLLDEVEQAA